MTPARAFATIGLGLAIAGAIGTAIVRSVAPVPMTGVAFGFDEATMVGIVVEGLTWASVGALLLVRRPENVVGWLMVVVGAGYALSQVSVASSFAFAADGTAQGDRLAQVAGWLLVLAQLAGIFQVAIGFLFPTGHTQSRAWARFMVVFWIVAGVFSALSLFQPGALQLLPGVQNPFGVGPDLRGDQPLAPFLSVASVVIISCLGLSMTTRYRAAGRVERQQLKWFVLALILSAAGLGLAVLETTVLGRPTSAVGLTIYVFAGAAVPVAIGIAILRYRLFAIDRIVSRTIAYALVVGVLGVLFYAIVISLSSLFASYAQADAIAVAVSTLVVFAGFQAISRPVRHAVDRRFNRAHYDAEQMAVAFSIRLRDEVDLRSVADDLAATVRQTVDPATSTLWLRPTSRDHMKPFIP